MSTSSFNPEDKAFIKSIINNPADLTAWLAYADWLDEHNSPNRAEFVRLQVRRGLLAPADAERSAVDGRLEELRRKLNRDWVAFFDRPEIENCEYVFAYECPKHWEKLKTTRDIDTRYCEACAKLVYYCHDIFEAREHARQGDCVAVSLSVSRSPDDLSAEESEDVVHLMGVLAFDSDVIPLPPPDPPRKKPWWKFW